MDTNTDPSYTLTDFLEIINDSKRRQELFWQNIKNCAKNGTVPEEIPTDAALIVSPDIFEKMSDSLKIKLSGRLFENKLLPEDTLLVTKKLSMLLS